MKTLLCLALTFVLFSCKEIKNQEEYQIKQIVTREQTAVLVTDSIKFSTHAWMSLSEDFDSIMNTTYSYLTPVDTFVLRTSYTDYNQKAHIYEVMGSYNYIDSIKCIEYNNALSEMKEIEKEAKILENKLKTLNNKKCK